MQLAGDGTLLLSPSDLTAHLACAHLTQLELQVQEGTLARPVFENEQAELVRRKGDAHEAAYLAQLVAEGRDVVEIGLGADHDWDRAARATVEAIRSGADIVYQAVLMSEGWRGLADFLERLPDGSYEVVDTKLARHAKPAAVLQLTFYSYELERIQGRLPERMHVVLGTGVRESFRPADFGAYYRHARKRLLRAIAERPDTYPWKVEHCDFCSFSPICNDRWDEDDHLLRVANIRRDQIERLSAAGITTLEALGETVPGTVVPRIAPATFETLRHQAELQLWARRNGARRYELLPPQEGRGLARLPAPSPGDLFFDIEGDPYYEADRSLEYLFGITDAAGAFRAIWAYDRAGEKTAVEQVIDLFTERLAEHPDMHVYHYASYETSALKRLVAEHSTREEELDELLRREVFCDLLNVVRQSLRISYESYSIKKVREFFMVAETTLDGGADAIVDFERWLEEGDGAILEAIERYNEEDCLSTLLLRDWLVERKAEAEKRFGVEIPWRAPPEGRERAEEDREALDERTSLRERLLASPDASQVLLGHALEYHRREEKPVWWAFFDRVEKTPAELVDDPESIGCLEPAGPGEQLPKPKRSTVYPLRFPAQAHRMRVGDSPVDPATKGRAGEIVELDDAEGLLRLKRATNRDAEPLPGALVPGGPYDTDEQQAAIARFARSVLSGDGRYPHLERLLRREPPLGGARVQRESLEAMRALVEEVEGSYLFVQGPPGSGKTWTGARLITHLLARGKRVAVASQSHKAIHKLLAEVEEAAIAEGVSYRGLKKASSRNEESFYEDRFVRSEPDGDAFAGRSDDLFAGTGWLLCRDDLDSTLDYLFVDEAGQVSLADALALGTCARTIVLLGDPVQLAQVTQGVHPEGAGRSVLEHLLQERPTVPEEMGLFLERSFRMHPDIAGYVSSAFYEDRLRSDERCARQGTSLGTGVRWLPVEHVGNSTSSEEEAEAIRSAIARLLGETWTDHEGVTRTITPQDVMVVSPFNDQVRLLKERLQEGVSVGTVDKFQGQEAPVVFFSMAASSGADAPRGIDFLLSRNRLNVAISRAKCLAYLACSPTLLDVDCRTIEHMRLANALCRYVELASDG